MRRPQNRESLPNHKGSRKQSTAGCCAHPMPHGGPTKRESLVRQGGLNNCQTRAGLPSKDNLAGGTDPLALFLCGHVLPQISRVRAVPGARMSPPHVSSAPGTKCRPSVLSGTKRCPAKTRCMPPAGGGALPVSRGARPFVSANHRAQSLCTCTLQAPQLTASPDKDHQKIITK